MLLLVLLARAAAVLVLVHVRLRETRPDVAALASRRVQQLAAVVLVPAKAADGLVGALQVAARPSTATSGSPVWRPQQPQTLMES